MGKKFKLLICSLIVSIFVFIINHTINDIYIDVKDIKIHTDTEELKGLTIIQFTDTHYNGSKKDKLMSKVVERINSLNADLVIFNGDLIDFKYKGTDFKYLSNKLNDINAKYGKYAVYGNHDRNNGREVRYEKVLKESGFKLLKNQEEVINIGKSKVSLIGLDDYLLGDFENVLPSNGSEYSIALAHEPDMANELDKSKYDLQLSGHTHGGQVRLPFIGRISKVRGGIYYDKGMYTLSDKMSLYVSSGIGNSRLDIRFGNIPEIVSIELV